MNAAPPADTQPRHSALTHARLLALVPVPLCGAVIHWLATHFLLLLLLLALLALGVVYGADMFLYCARAPHVPPCSRAQTVHCQTQASKRK
jgi:hypothetical protein